MSQSDPQRAPLILSRIDWIHQQLVAAFGGGTGLANATVGREREYFIDLFLRNCLPPQYRFGSGDIVDSKGSQTGQLDIVIELPFFPSLPLVGATRERLYVVEGVAAVLEVKSNISTTWSSVLQTAERVRKLEHGAGSSSGYPNPLAPKGKIPVFAVGYKGWGTADIAWGHFSETETVDVFLQLDPPMYFVRNRMRDDQIAASSGARCLGEMLIDLCNELTSISTKRIDLRAYFNDA